MRFVSFSRLATAVAIAVAALPCAAQYAWTDSSGTRHYSDQPPPPSVRASRILGNAASTETAPPEAPAHHEAPQKEAAPHAPTLAERNAEFLKRRAEREAQEKKAQEKAKLERENAGNCTRARSYRATLESGQRLVSTDGNGQRSFMTDRQRADELRDVNRLLQKCR